MNTTALAFAREYNMHPKDEVGNNFWWGTLVGDMYFYKNYKNWSVPVLVINTVQNKIEGNGQFRPFLEKTIALCNAQQCDLIALNVIPYSLATYLITRWGFTKVSTEPGLVYRCI